MALFEDIDEVKEVIGTIDQSLAFNDIKPYFEAVEESHIKKVLGNLQYTSLHASYAGNTLSVEEEALLKRVRKAEANLALFFAIPLLNVSITNGGILTSQSTAQVSASQYKVEELKRSVLLLAHNGFEELLKFLQENLVDYPDYEGTAAHLANRANFINSAAEFSSNYNIQDSLWVFWNIRTILTRIENDRIKSVTGDDLYAELKEQVQTETVTADNEKLLVMIRMAVAQLTIADAIDEMAFNIDERGISIYTTGTTSAQTITLRNPAPGERMGIVKEKCKNIGEAKIELLVAYLNKYSSTYPLFEVSEAYRPDDNAQFENEEDNGIFFTGGI